MASLTIWRFDSAQGAYRAAEKVASLSRSSLITIHDAAVMTWEEGHNKPKLRQLHNLAGRGALSGAFWGMLFGLIFLMPLLGAAIGATAGAVGGSLADVGIDDKLIARIRGEISPGTSALFLLSSDAVIDKVRAAFSDAGTPTLIFTNLSNEQERSLREVFEEESEPVAR